MSDEPILLPFRGTVHAPGARAPRSPVVAGTSPPQIAQSSQEGGSKHRIRNPVLLAEGGTEAPLSDLADLYKAVADEHDDGWRPVSPTERERVRQTLSLGAFYGEFLAERRVRSAKAGELARGTLEKERQALRRWEDWDREQRPAEWPASTEWGGLPLGYVTGGYVQRWLQALRGTLAAATVRSTWYQVRTVLNAAVRLGILDAAPRPHASSLEDRDEDDADLYARVWSTAELEAIYGLLPADLQSAWVLACSIGARPVDLFALRWDQVRLDEARPIVRFRARKTGKLHAVPLAPVAGAHLRRLLAGRLFAEGPLFPGRQCSGQQSPERSWQARARNAETKAAIAAAGVQPVPGKPWQVCRATCNTRLENHRPGVGQWVLGHANGVNAQSYHDPSDLVWSAIETLPQPQAWLRGTTVGGDDLPGQRLLV